MTHINVTMKEEQRKSPLVLRDIPDVEALVSTVMQRLSLPLEGELADRLVSAGVAAVFRVDRAVPRSEPLSPFVQGMLEQRLLELWQANEREPSVPQLRAA